MNLAPLVAQETGAVRLRWPDRLRGEAEFRSGDVPLLRDVFAQEWPVALTRPVTLEAALEGASGLYTIGTSAWRRLVGEPEPRARDLTAPAWMEATPLEDTDEMLLYPNTASDEPELLVYLPVRVGDRRSLLLRLRLGGGEAERPGRAPLVRRTLGAALLSERVRGELESGACTELIEGELDEREIVCVETGCRRSCTKSFITQDGFEILECRC